MENRNCYEDIEPGQAIPGLTKHPTTQQLVMYAGASEEFYQIHYDKDFALKKGLPGVVVPGMLLLSFLGQVLTDWIGAWGDLRRIKVNYRGMAFPGQSLQCQGRVIRKYVEAGERLAACEIWIENERGEKPVLGEALVSLPSRRADA